MPSNRVVTWPRLRRLFCSLLIVAAAIAALGAFGSSRASSQASPPEQAVSATKIAPWVMEHTTNGQQAEFFVVLADQADLSGAAALPTKTEKGAYVYNALWSKSQATQGPIQQWLRERGVKYQSFYIVNAILVNGSREIAEMLATRPDVARVEGNPHIQNSFPQPGPAADVPSQPGAPATIEPGINYTHAPSVWALGFNGHTLRVFSKVRYLVRADLLGAVVSLGMTVALIVRYGSLGAAIGASGSLVAQNLLYQAGLRLGTGIPVFEWRYLGVYLAILLGALGLLLVQLLFAPPVYVAFTLLLVVSCTVVRSSRGSLNVEQTFPEVLRFPLARWLFAV